MPERCGRPFRGSRDATAGLSLADRFRRHADSLVRARRSPLYARMMLAGADDIDSGGAVAELFDGVPRPPGSVPQLRLLAALHYLVLAGGAPALAEFYPSAGGTMPPEKVWPVALATIRENGERIKARLTLTVQTNEPGRSTVLYSALLWLTARFHLPIRLVEIGASAGLNLLADRYCYVVAGQLLGDPGSDVRFCEPWVTPPDIDLPLASQELRIVHRSGCDVAPLDPTDADDRLTLLSYIWPDELERIDRTKAALRLAARTQVPVMAAPAGTWLPATLHNASSGELTVIWHSLVRQYVDRREWDVLEHAFREATLAGDRPVVWLSMEPGRDHLANVELNLRTRPGTEHRLAACGDHGPPVAWDASADVLDH